MIVVSSIYIYLQYLVIQLSSYLVIQLSSYLVSQLHLFSLARIKTLASLMIVAAGSISLTSFRHSMYIKPFAIKVRLTR
jgi:hypothetical protein